MERTGHGKNRSWKEPVMERTGHGNNLDNPNKVMEITVTNQIRSWK